MAFACFGELVDSFAELGYVVVLEFRGLNECLEACVERRLWIACT
jgi:hypothetical protein